MGGYLPAAEAERAAQYAALGLSGPAGLYRDVPDSVYLNEPLHMPEPKSELEVRRMSIAAIRLSPASEVPPQLSLFASQQDDERETALMKASIGLHKRFGKNSLVRGMDLFEAGTTIERNNQIGGHRR